MGFPYISVYTTLFAVFLNVMVFISQQEFKAFKVPDKTHRIKFLSSLAIIVLCPAFFFMFSLTLMANFPDKVELLFLLLTLFWVMPVYGYQQAWLWLAFSNRWLPPGAEAKAEDKYVWKRAFWFAAVLPTVSLLIVWWLLS